MNKGKVLKFRIGHEANCSSGMVAMYILMIAAAAHVPLSLVSAIVQAIGLRKSVPKKKWHILYWVVPQVLGLGITAFLVWLSLDDFYGYSSYMTVLALAIGFFFALAITVSYLLASRLRHSWLVIPLAPLVFVLGVVVFIFAAYGGLYFLSAW